MALLGTYWDIYRNRTIAGGNDVLVTTFAHSLGTTPDVSIPVLRSVQRASVSPQLVAEPANASLATVGVLLQSIASPSAPVTDFDLYLAYVHSIAR